MKEDNKRITYRTQAGIMPHECSRKADIVDQLLAGKKASEIDTKPTKIPKRRRIRRVSKK